MLGIHETIALGIALDNVQALAGMLRHQLIEPLSNDQDFLGLDFNIRGLSLGATAGLVNHGASVGQTITFAFSATAKQKCTHGRGLSDTHGAHIGLDELHGVVHRQPCGH